MGAPRKRGNNPKKRIFTSSAFVASSAMAVLVVAVLIVIARWDNSRFDFFTPVDHTSTPTGTPTASQTTSLPPGTSPTTGVAVSGTSMGSPNAPITIVEYSDFQCSICQQFYLATEGELRKAYIETGKVRFVYKHFIVYGDESTLAAEASEAAAEQNKFWPFHDLLMQARASPKAQDLGIDKLGLIARQAGLNMAAFDSSLKSGKYRGKVLRDSEEGTSLGVTGTPTFFVNGNKGVGAPPFDVFKKLIDELLAGKGGN